MAMHDTHSPYGAVVYESGVAKRDDVATVAALKALAATHPAHVGGNVVAVLADGSEWVYHPTSSLTGDDILVVDPTNAAGRWLRKVGRTVLYLPFTYATADGATLLTVPAGCVLKLDSAHWKITTAFEGGSSSAIGIDSSIDTTPGDILGGAAGDVEATLTAGTKAGTIGAKMDSDSELHAQILPAATTIRLQRITSAFTSGVGAVGLVVDILTNAGA
jgi:hypothetical protein